MKEVTKQQFFDKINPLDVVIRIENNDSFFKLRSGQIIGKIVDIGDKVKTNNRYYLN